MKEHLRISEIDIPKPALDTFKCKLPTTFGAQLADDDVIEPTNGNITNIAAVDAQIE